ncbi:MAG: AtpZ/AtpI family protein [Planctomycetota bacterium]|jgi:hypothetical protein|nr:AtpZ/AtpI family protein [Planctomycetota bacterium]
MVEITRTPADEFFNLRPPLLLVCFLWGIAAGFSLNFFRPDEANLSSQVTNPARMDESVRRDIESATPPMSDMDRRHAGAPTIAPVGPAPLSRGNERLSFENLTIQPPLVSLTTEGGLTGKNTQRPRLSATPPPVEDLVPVTSYPPLIPDLAP